MNCSRKAFTLIELLIVVAIIAILAAIAVPNFLEAQTRSKVSRVKADFRSIDTALNAYYVDYNKYPRLRTAGFMFTNLTTMGSNITSPIAYMTSVPVYDIFRPENAVAFNPNGYFQYFSYMPGPIPGYSWVELVGYEHREAFSMVSWGPDRAQSQGEHLEYAPNFRGTLPPGTRGSNGPVLYDPTNGTVSDGDIVRFGGSTRSPYGVAP